MAHVVVVGAGVFGTWIAHHLVSPGMRVTLVDAYGPGNSRSSSGDESRIIRRGYGPDVIYSRLADRSLELWREFSSRMSDDARPLLYQCGVLWLGGNDPYTRATRQTLEREQYRVQILDAAELRLKYRQLMADDVGVALFEPDCGALVARRAVQSLAGELAGRGVRVVRSRVSDLAGTGAARAVRLQDGSELSADLLVFACGAWLPAVFPELLRERIRPTRQVVIYFGTPAGDDRFGPHYMPAWIDLSAGIYGVPDLEGRGMKVGIDTRGPQFDPDDDDRTLDQESVRQTRSWLARRLPGMAKAPIVESRICQYENTPAGDFLIDRHPDYENVWIAGGGSGHGFKHGPAVGEYVAALITGSVVPEARFTLQAQNLGAARAIY
jgi:glycine/D-amino acid oxidase-like deaminating enzyme